MCCKQGENKGHGFGFGTTQCNCHSNIRRFLTKEEKIERLENYISELKKEIDAAEEHLKNIREES